MNFSDLTKKLNAIDSGQRLDECGCDGGMSPMHASPQPQQDSVNMNITVSGQGAGGIRDILDIIRNIDKPKDDSPHGTMVVGGDSEFSSPNIEDMMVIKHGDEQELAPDQLSQHNIDEPEEPEFDVDHDGGDEHADEAFGNSKLGDLGPETFAISAVTAMGDDLASKGKIAAPKVNGGENPMAESLVRNLHRLYSEIKTRR